MGTYKKPKSRLHRDFVYLHHDTILNSLSAFEAGKIDEIIQKTADASDRSLEGFVNKNSWPLIQHVSNQTELSLGILSSDKEGSDISRFLTDPKVIDIRKRARLNTITTTEPDLDLTELPPDFEFGPDIDYVRLVQQSQSFARLRIWARLAKARIETRSGA